MKGSKTTEIQLFIDKLNEDIETWKDTLLLSDSDLPKFLVKEYHTEVKEVNKIEGEELATELWELGDTLKLLREVIVALESPINKNNLSERLTIFFKIHPPKIIFNSGFSVDYHGLSYLRFVGPLITVLPYLEDNSFKRCEQCSQFMLTRGKTKRFCSDACRKKHFPQKPYDPVRKNYLKNYEKLFRVYGPMAKWPENIKIEFKKDHPDKIINNKGMGKNHGKKT